MKLVELPLGQVVYLRGTSAEAFELELEALPARAPAALIYYSPADRTMRALVESILDQLESAAVRLFHVWLPDAAILEGPAGSGVSAARSLAADRASKTHYFGAFLADLAEEAIRGSGSTATRFAPEVRAAELAKILAECYGRDGVAILVDVPHEITAESASALVAACDWFAAHGSFGVWLTGRRLPDGGRFSTIDFGPGPPDEENALVPSAESATDQQRGVLIFPPLEGMPRPDSPSESLLESHLKKCPWAARRVWNRPYKPFPNIIIDLAWIDDWCAVEIDGREHRHRHQFESDHRRDVLLQTEGFSVLRFTSDEVLRDVFEVTERIEKFLHTRRAKNERSE